MSTAVKKVNEKTAKKVPSITGIAASNNNPSPNGEPLKSPLPSARRKSSARTNKPKIEQQVKQHRFQKKIFSHPTWCQYANKFIWGLNKSGYECRVCGLPVSRRYIADAKKSHCGQPLDRMDEGAQTATLTEKKVFTIYLPHGAKKSIVLNPDALLGSVLEKVCRERGIDISAFVPEDTNGKILTLNMPLGRIEGNEITFTAKESSKDQGESQTSSTTASPLSAPASSTVTKGSVKPNDNNNGNKKRSNSSSQLPKPIVSQGAGVSKKSVVEAYAFGPELGSGAFSIVRSATHKETEQVVAIKILDKYEEDDEQTAKFKQEIAIISSLHHENIVQFHELDEDDENFYVVMELVGGGELFDYIINNGALSEPDAAKVAAQVLKAVEYMHSVGTAHRDLKPENLLFSSLEDKVVKIADFGESKSFKDGTLSTYCGTPDYMAPEIIRGDNYGPEVDVWAIGVITYVMLAGFPPFDGENDVEVFASILSIKYDFPSPEWDPISPEAKDFIKSILVDKPEKRLTATQALNHKWITDNVIPEYRVNTARPVPTKAPVSVSTTAGTTTPVSKGDSSPAPSSVITGISSTPSLGKINPDDRDSRKASKRENRVSDDGLPSTPSQSTLTLTPPGSSDQDFLDKKPKKVLLDTIDDLLTSSEELSLVMLGGELKTMKVVVEGTTGKPKSVELEKVLYLAYWRRLKEVSAYVKKQQKKKKN